MISPNLNYILAIYEFNVPLLPQDNNQEMQAK